MEEDTTPPFSLEIASLSCVPLPPSQKEAVPCAQRLGLGSLTLPGLGSGRQDTFSGAAAQPEYV